MRKKWFVICIIGLLCGGGMWLFKTERAPTTRTTFPPGEQFIRDHLLQGSGMIRTNFSDSDEGDLFLSESNGLWLIYLALTNDEEAFAAAYKDTKKHLQAKDKLFSWRIFQKDKATSNALIDDLRIIRALYLMADVSEHSKWQTEANEIGKNIVTYHLNDAGHLVDFYDWKYKERTDSITLSYIDLFVLKEMVKQQLISKEQYDTWYDMLDNLPTENDWYPFDYDVAHDEFAYTKEVNLIDQLYIALHKEEVGLTTDKFHTILLQLYHDEGKLYGRYDSRTKEPTVAYESVAVYALAAFYAYQKGDINFANELLINMRQLQELDSNNRYYGGFVDIGTNTTHSFDNLLALIVERINENGQYSE